MNKLTAIKIKYGDGTYSDEIPISVLSENVEWDSTHTLVDVLGSINVDVTGTVQDQISQLFNEKVNATQLQNYVASQLNEDVSTWLNNNVNPVGSAVIVDKSLTIEGAAADAKIVGDNISDLKSALHDYSAYNVLSPFPTSASTYNGVTWTWSGDVCSYSGLSSNDSFYRLFWVDRYTLPTWMVADGSYQIKCATTDTQVSLDLLFYSGGEILSTVSFTNDGVLNVPHTAEGVQIRYHTAGGKTVSGTITSEILGIKPNDEIVSNVNGKMISWGNSILTGTVFVNGTRNHRSAIYNRPYNGIARALNIPEKNISHTVVSDTGMVSGTNTPFHDLMTIADFSEYDFALAHLWTTDIAEESGYTLGDEDSTADDGTLAGSIIDVYEHVKQSNTNCQLIIVGVPPVSYTSGQTGANVFTGNHSGGYSIHDCDIVMHRIADKYHFIFIDWEDLDISYVFQSLTDGNNVHPNNEDTYRVMGEYLGMCVRSGIDVESNVQYQRNSIYVGIPNGGDLNNYIKSGKYYLNATSTYLHCPRIDFHSLMDVDTESNGRIVQKLYYANYGIEKVRYYIGTSWTEWHRLDNRENFTATGEYIQLSELSVITSVANDIGYRLTTKNLFNLVPVEASPVNGIAYTIADDGIIKLSGSATAKATFTLFDTNSTPLPVDNTYYTVSMGRHGDDYYQKTAIGYALYLSEYDTDGTTWLRQVHDIGQGITFFAVPGHRYVIRFKVESGTTLTWMPIAPQIEFGTNRTVFVKHQSKTFASDSASGIEMFEGENVLTGVTKGTGIKVTYIDGANAVKEKQDTKTAKNQYQYLHMSSIAGGGETESPECLFTRIPNTCVENSYKLLTDYRDNTATAYYGVVGEFGIGWLVGSNGSTVIRTMTPKVSAMGNYICLPIYAYDCANISSFIISIEDTSSNKFEVDVDKSLHEGMNWFITNAYFRKSQNDFDKDHISSIKISFASKEGLQATVVLGSIFTYDFKPMCTFIFDDGQNIGYTYTYPTLKAHGFRGVFACPTKRFEDVSGNYISSAHAREMNDDRCDIISHTVDHVNLTSLTPAEQRRQICKAREEILRVAPGRNAFYFAPPNVNQVERVRRHEWVSAIMDLECTVIKHNDDHYNLLPNLDPKHTYCFGIMNKNEEAQSRKYYPTRLFDVDEVKNAIDVAIQYGLWVGFGMHYFADTAGGLTDNYGWLKSDFEEVLDYLSDKSADIDVVTYRMAYDKM